MQRDVGMLAPMLKPGDIIVMDNLPAHKVAGYQASDGEHRRPPSLSAALQPRPPSDRERPFQTQGNVRAAAARTFDTLEAAVASALAKVQPAECLNFFAHAGYGFN